jgi:hypothetical protein
MGITKPFAKVVFTIAGIWGILIMTPLYFTFDAVGRAYPPPITHPDLYYGFIGVTLAWQIAFLVIATDPVRYRTIMLAGILEKFLYVTTMIVLFFRGYLQPGQATVIIVPDGTLGLLFVAAFFRTPIVEAAPARSTEHAQTGILNTHSVQRVRHL